MKKNLEMCQCGHREGVHYQGDKRCFAAEKEEGTTCSCMYFRPAPSQPSPNEENPYRCDKCFIGDLHKARVFQCEETNCGCPCPKESTEVRDEKIVRIIKEYVAMVLRTYQSYDYIDFAARSSSAKGTINWSEEVAKFLIEQDPRLTQTLTTLLDGE